MDREEWDERYRGDELLWRAEPNQFLVSEVEPMQPGRALDLACGEGRNAVWLAARGWQATGVDFSAVALGKARRLAADRGVEVEWVEADVLEWQPPSRAFDLVLLFYLQVGPEARARALRSAAEATAVGGTLLLVAHDRSNLENGYGGPQDQAVLYSSEDVVADLDDLQVERSGPVVRRVSTPGGDAEAIDVLVRAVRRPVTSRG